MKKTLIIFAFALLILSCKKDNKIPSANAGGDQSVKEGATVTLDGSASSDQDGDVLTYRWTAPSGITLSSETKAQPTFTAPESISDTQYTFSLVVNDGKASSLNDEVVITVANEDKFLTSIKAGQTDGVGIKYVDFEPDEKLVSNPADSRTRNLFLDLNNDSIDDFELCYTINARSCCYRLYLTITPLGDNYICNQKTDTTYVEALAQGDIIDNNNTWLKSKTYLFDYWYSNLTSPDGTPLISEKISGSWYNQHNVYMGVKIIKDGKELFSWIDVNYQSDPVYTSIKEVVVRRFAISLPY